MRVYVSQGDLEVHKRAFLKKHLHYLAIFARESKVFFPFHVTLGALWLRKEGPNPPNSYYVTFLLAHTVLIALTYWKLHTQVVTRMYSRCV